MTEPARPVKMITESGWYRITGGGWERVAGPEVDPDHMEFSDSRFDLVLVRFDAEEVTLW